MKSSGLWSVGAFLVAALILVGIFLLDLSPCTVCQSPTPPAAQVGGAAGAAGGISASAGASSGIGARAGGTCLHCGGDGRITLWKSFLTRGH